MTFRAFLSILALAALGGIAFLAIPRWEGRPPVLSGVTNTTLGRSPSELRIELADDGAGLRRFELRVLSAAGSKTLLTRTFPGSTVAGGSVAKDTIILPLDAAELALPDGPATLTAVATDWSLRGGFGGNRTDATATLVVDTVPPRVAALSGLTYVHRGGSGAVVYRVGADTVRHGVRVADAFFAGQELPAGQSASDSPGKRDTQVAIFGVPVHGPEDPVIQIVAWDAAGNEGFADFPARLRERAFETRELTLARRFLDQKVLPLARANGLPADDATQAFRSVNEELRERNERRIRELLGDDPVERHFSGGFEQMRGSKVTSRFAEHRRYRVDDREVSSATHYGFDLASTAGAKVTSANAGIVAIAEDLGIYGNCIVIDHGLGVRSLYGHLGSMDVGVGDAVAKGAVIGRSGMTGLAGGDHLHFAMLVGSVYVDPLEWWDERWVRSHVEVRLRPRD